MKLTKVLIYFGILAALAAYIYFVEIRYKEKQETEKRERERIAKVEKDKVIQVELKPKDGPRIELKKLEDRWLLTEPVKVKADDDAVMALLTSVSESQFEKVLKEKDINWAEYGLEEPDFTVTVSTRDDSVSLLFGASNPAKTSYYVRAKGDTRLLLVADTLKNSLNKTLLQLRDKIVFGIAPGDVDRVVVVREGKETELKREGSEKWGMLKPEKIKVKGADLNRNLIALTNLQANDVIDIPGKEEDPYGLNAPSEVIVLEGKNRSQTLEVGKAKEEKEKKQHSKPDRYARIQGQDTIYVIPTRALDDFVSDPDKLRDRYLMDFKPHEAERVEVELDGKTWLAVKSKDDKWTLEKPEKKENVESWPVTGLLWDLKNLEWKDMKQPAPADPAAAQLDKPRLTVSVLKKGDKEALTLKVGWKDEPVQAPETGGEKASEAPGSSGAGDKAPENAPQAGKADRDPRMPALVNAMVQPYDDGNPLFALDGSFIERLRQDLERLAGEPKK